MSQHSNNRDSFRRMNSASSRGSRGGRRGSYNRIDTSNFPTEQGIICSLKESFGFIHCAQRLDEIFFHYSEVQNEHPDNLDIDVEVEFKVGQSEKNPDKLAAYDVRVVPTGTVIWEIEDEANKEYYGLVEKVARNYSDSNRGGGGGGGGGGPIEGTVRVVQLDDNGVVVKTTTDDDLTPQNKDEDQKGDSNNNNQRKQQKELIRYRPDEYQPPQQDEQENRPASSRRSTGANNNRLFRGDLLKFRILIDRRTNQRYARYIALVKTEKERREEQLLANGVEEEGVIIALNKGYGFLKSNKRHEHVYFHFSNFPEAQAQQQQQGSNNNSFSDVRKTDNNGVLRKGQEVKFLVVTEESTNNKNSNNSEPTKKVSARKLQSLPKGSVVFHKVIARGVKGVVTMIPQPPSTSTGDRGYADDKDGNIRLLHPMESIGEEKDSSDDDDYQNVKDVSLQFSDAPGGVYTFQQRGQVVNGLWIQQGDTLLFDVVKELADGSYRAAPTRHTITVGGEIVPPKDEEQEGGEGGGKENIDEGVIRLVSLSLIGRSEGTIHTIKPQAGYGFIHFAERPIDVHFSTYNVIPEELASDLRKSLGVDTGNRSVPLEMGASVQFDICAHGTVHSSSGGVGGRGGRNYGRGGSGGGGHNERENVKGHRILILPPSTVKMDVLIASGVKGVVKSADTKQLYAGFVDLEDDNIQPMSEEDRHPLVTRMVTEFMEETTRPFGRESLVYHDVLSVKEDDVVVNILKSKANGKLSYQHIPVAGFEAHPGRLCIRRADPAPVSDSVPTADDAAAGAGENTTLKEKEGGGGDEEDKASNDDKIVEGEDADAKPVKKKKDQKKPIKNLRFDKPCLSEECKGDIPPGPGDTIVCDIAQSRRTGKILIHNMKIVERAKPEAGGSGGEESTLSSGIGAVKDVMINRNFGFISVYDENASKRELLFFQLSEVVGGSGGFGGKGSNKKSPVRKNDEVKFDICMDKNGKRVAKKVQIIAKGSIPSKESKNACKGYVLMEPSHSSLKDTPNRRSNRSPLRGRSKSPMRVGGVASRWGSVDKDDSRHSKTHEVDIHEEGCILLLEDKIGMFTGKPTRRKRSQSVDDDARSVGSIDSVDSFDDLRSVGSTDGGTTSDEDEKVDILLNSHLPYKNGAIAIQGAGSSSIMDTKAAPRRGDLVSFVKSRKGKSIRDVRIVTRQAATLLRGRLENIERDATGKGGKAKFIAATDKEELYEVNLVEVVSCAPGILKEKVNVEGILHEGRIYGICRTSDLYLESKLGTTHKQRPKLNLTVKKDRGGTVVAQSMMAKGPDNTIGFAAGWTTRKSQYAASQGE